MDHTRLQRLLRHVRSGKTSVSEAVDSLRAMPFEDIGPTRVDTHRSIRCGMAEVIFCEGKRPGDVGRIARRIARSGDALLATRASPEHFEAVRRVAPKAVYHEPARAVTLGGPRRGKSGAMVVTAGTADIPVAEEARVTAWMMGARAETLYDAGVAGIHRLLAETRRLQRAKVIVVAAGMEGALPSVVGGLAGCPVIAVPTSIGYGASFGGLAALLAMINSCAAGVSVVNIDNGFGAGYLAGLILTGGRR